MHNLRDGNFPKVYRIYNALNYLFLLVILNDKYLFPELHFSAHRYYITKMPDGESENRIFGRWGESSAVVDHRIDNTVAFANQPFAKINFFAASATRM